MARVLQVGVRSEDCQHGPRVQCCGWRLARRVRVRAPRARRSRPSSAWAVRGPVCGQGPKAVGHSLLCHATWCTVRLRDLPVGFSWSGSVPARRNGERTPVDRLSKSWMARLCWSSPWALAGCWRPRHMAGVASARLIGAAQTQEARAQRAASTQHRSGKYLAGRARAIGCDWSRRRYPL